MAARHIAPPLRRREPRTPADAVAEGLGKGRPHQAARGGGQAQGAAHARPRRQRASCTRRSSATASSIPQGAGRHRQVPRREVPLDLTDRTKLATLVESATGTKFVSRFGTGGPRPQRTGAVCSAPQEASFGIFGTAACTLRSLPHVCGWLALSAALLLHARAYAVHTCRGLHQLDERVVALWTS